MIKYECCIGYDKSYISRDTKIGNSWKTDIGYKWLKWPDMVPNGLTRVNMG